MQAIRVDIHRGAGALALRYVLAGRLERLRVPPRRAPGRADGLWRHTCFELFVATPGEPAYQEFNFSPSGEWAAYRFAGYREGGAVLDCPAPEIRTAEAGTLEVQAEVPWPAGALRIGVSAVVEDDAGRLAYWALRHPAATPDFHHPASFTVELDEVRR